jgi:hypothetical protein
LSPLFISRDGLFYFTGALKAKIFESQIILKSLGARKPKGLNRIPGSQNPLRSRMPEAEEL